MVHLWLPWFNYMFLVLFVVKPWFIFVSEILFSSQKPSIASKTPQLIFLLQSQQTRNVPLSQ